MRLTIILMFTHFMLLGQHHEGTHSLIKIDLVNKNIADLAELGLEVDHGIIYPRKQITNVYSESELSEIKNAGFDYEVVISDVDAYYKIHGTMDPYHEKSNLRSGPCDKDDFSTFDTITTPINYVYGSMGGYLTYAEAMVQLDRMYEEYPDIITPRQAVDNIITHDGNEIHYLTICQDFFLLILIYI